MKNTTTPTAADAAKLRRFNSLKQIRLGQTGGRAAATQRKIEALYLELYTAGVLDHHS